MRKIGIFGGSFDPIHVAHLIMAERVREERGLDRVLFVPALKPPHKRRGTVASPQDRLEMVRLAIAGNPAFEACPLELERGGPSYTLLTVRQLRAQFGPSAQLFLILGSDNLQGLSTWWRTEELVREVDFIVVARPGCPVDESLARLSGLYGEIWARRVKRLAVEGLLLAISATDVRRRLRIGRSVRYLLPESVYRYILRRGLYGAGQHAR